MARRHLLGQGRPGRIDPARTEGELLGVAVNMRMAAAGMRRHGEIHRRCGLRRFGKAGLAAHGCSSQPDMPERSLEGPNPTAFRAIYPVARPRSARYL